MCIDLIKDTCNLSIQTFLVARDQIQNAAVNVQDENKDMDLMVLILMNQMNFSVIYLFSLKLKLKFSLKLYLCLYASYLMYLKMYNYVK